MSAFWSPTMAVAKRPDLSQISAERLAVSPGARLRAAPRARGAVQGSRLVGPAAARPEHGDALLVGLAADLAHQGGARLGRAGELARPVGGEHSDRLAVRRPARRGKQAAEVQRGAGLAVAHDDEAGGARLAVAG